MKIDNVPQDDENYYEGHRRAVYALDAEGKYVLASSKGWKVETFFTAMALSDLDEKASETVLAIRKGKLSPLAFYMMQAKMDAKLLAAETGFFRWQVKRHLSPRVYAKLKRSALERYARALCIDIHHLRDLPQGLADE